MTTAIHGENLWFTAPRQVAIESAPITAPGPSQVLLRALVSGISAGTELLVYRNQIPPELPLDTTIPGMGQAFQYPTTYGYALVGEVIAAGATVDPGWLGQQAFAFAPHATHLLTEPAQLLPLPAGVTPDKAIFLPNMETALSLVMDGNPVPGERVVVLGQGVVGLLVAALLSQFPGLTVLTVDRYGLRREVSRARGATAVFSPSETEALRERLGSNGADLVYELTGNPAALDDAISLSGFGARVVIGSWYGQKRVGVDLGGRFHRNHMQLISSQVSQLAPRWQARWTKARRLDVAWRLLATLATGDLISHRFSLAAAAEAYALLDERPAEALQVIFDYRAD